MSKISTWPNGNTTYVTDDSRYMIIVMMDGWEWERHGAAGKRQRSKIEILDKGKMVYQGIGPWSGVNMPWDTRLAFLAMIDFMGAEAEAWAAGSDDFGNLFWPMNHSLLNLITNYADELTMVKYDAEEQDQV